GTSTGILTEQNKEGRMHPPHLPPFGKEVYSESLPQLRQIVARMLKSIRVLLYFEWRCFDY
ncbi:MAG: hypothetical protein RR092_05440, partial [Oscillospiraceae bacterium]